MNFPVIHTIDDVLPAIRGRDEFIVAERPYGTVINYQVMLEDSFDDPIRRECRGIIFYKDGTIMSRPFHKFFNIGEKNESRPANLDFGANPIIMDKLDGSMIRPIFLPDGSWRFGTKMGITDVANQAYNWLFSCNTPLHLINDYKRFIEDCKNDNITPIFEWCSRQQRIVVDYPEDRLVLTGLRDNFTGRYINIHNNGNIPVAQTWDGYTYHQLQEISVSPHTKDQEGWVIAWPDGKRVKMKVDWYITLHKVKESIAREKYVIDAILDDYLDDLKGKIQEQDLKSVEEFERDFRLGYLGLQVDMNSVWKDVKFKTELWINNHAEIFEPEAVKRGAKKYLAMELAPLHPDWMRPILFQMWDGKLEGTLEGVRQMLKGCTRTQREIDEHRYLWGGAKYEYNGVIE